MCRLMGIYGPINNWREIVMAFSRQAENGNLPPGRQTSPGHKDGWGMTIANQRHTAMIPLIRQLGSAYGSEAYREAIYALPDQPGILLCHLRKASDLIPITLSNTHPFVHDGWGFIHNGTVYQAQSLPRDQRLVFTSEDSDTEHLFHFLLTKIRQGSADQTVSEAIADAVTSFDLDYTALNLMLSNGRDLYVLRNFKKNADYYTLYCCGLPGGWIVSSQPIEFDGFVPDRWTLIANKSLLRIHGTPPQIEESRLG
jgi:predicted glutamine amidotransferase